MANPLYVSGNGAGADAPGSNTVTITAPSSISSGNLLLAFIGCGTAGALTITPPSGWTLIGTLENSAGDGTIWAYSRVATGSEPASYTWTPSLTSGSGVVLNYSGAGAVDVYGTDSGDSASWSSASLTTTAADDTLVVGATSFDGTVISTGSSGMTARDSYVSAGNYESTASFDLALGAAGSVGAKTGTLAASDHWTTIAVAISPPGSSPTFLARPPYIANQAVQRAATW